MTKPKPTHHFDLTLTEAEGKQLLVFIDAAVKSMGLPSVEAADALHKKIQQSYKQSKQSSNTHMKRYIAILNNTGPTDPEVTVLENSLGPIVWTRGGEGQYLGTLTGAFPIGKTVAFCGAGQGGEEATFTRLELPPNSPDYVAVTTKDFTSENGVKFSDGLLVRTGIEIRVYET